MKGATILRVKKCTITGDFNPRAHEGRDEDAKSLQAYFKKISIHAPMRGATFKNRILYFHNPISIHAPMRGATQA